MIAQSSEFWKHCNSMLPKLLFLSFLFIVFAQDSFTPLETPFRPHFEFRRTLSQTYYKNVDLKVQNGCKLNPNKYRLPKSLVPSFYKTHVDVNLKEFTFSGTQMINMTASRGFVLVMIQF